MIAAAQKALLLSRRDSFYPDAIICHLYAKKMKGVNDIPSFKHVLESLTFLLLWTIPA
jgi:hypothetical protein